MAAELKVIHVQIEAAIAVDPGTFVRLPSDSVAQALRRSLVGHAPGQPVAALVSVASVRLGDPRHVEVPA